MPSIYKNLPDTEVRLEKKQSSPLAIKPSTSAHLVLKLAIIGAFILSFFCFFLSWNLRQTLKAERRQREMLEASQVQLQEKTVSFESNTQQYKGEMARMREQLQKYDQMRKDLTKEIDNYQKQIGQMQAKARAQAAAAVKPAPVKVTPSVSAPKVLPAANVPALAETPESAKLPVSEETILKASALSGKEPQILTVNPKFHFVIINLGFRQEVKMGDMIKVEREGKQVGTLSIEKVYENFSAAQIVREPESAPFKEGDRISR